MAQPLISGGLDQQWAPVVVPTLRGTPGRDRAETSFGALLRDHRMNCRLTQEELAELSGLSVRAIRNLEIGRTERPQQHSVRQLAGALGLADDARDALLVAAGRARLRPIRTPVDLGPRGTSEPCELPADIPRLLGRAEIVAGISSFLSDTRDVTEPKLAVITGGPGAGKTATVVHIAHRLRQHFPDGQIYADLDQPDGWPMPADAVLGRLLRSLSISSVPDSVDERAALLRATVAARRVLLVLDNASSEAQIRPLLTVSPTSAVLVASRQLLTALRCGRTTVLPQLGELDALLLLTDIVGTPRVLAEPQSGHAIAAYCAYRPLALHIAGAWLATRPQRRLQELAELLREARGRLDHLEIGDLSLRASIMASYRRLADSEQLTIRLLVASGRIEFDSAQLNSANQNSVEKLLHAHLLLAREGGPHGIPRYHVDPLVRLLVQAPAD